VDHYLPYFRQQLITCPLSALLPFQSLFTEKFAWRSAPCSSSLLQCVQSTPLPLLSVPLQFLVYYSVLFCGAGVSLSRGLCCFIPGVAEGILHAAYLLTCWSASPKHVWSWCLKVQEPSCFLSVMWRGEAL
jgi:hypothetical protein